MSTFDPVRAPAVAGWAQVGLLVGAVGNPLLLLRLGSAGSRVQQTLPSRAAAAPSSATLSCSLVAITWTAW